MNDWFDYLDSHPAYDDSAESKTEKTICIVCGCVCPEENDAFCSDECEELEEEFGG